MKNYLLFLLILFLTMILSGCGIQSYSRSNINQLSEQNKEKSNTEISKSETETNSLNNNEEKPVATTNSAAQATSSQETVSTNQEKNGKYIGYIKNIFTKNNINYITIDYVQWLTNKDAIKAALEDNKCNIEGKTNSQAIAGLINYNIDMGLGIYGDCAPNGYYVRNQNSLLRTFPVLDNVQIKLQTYSYDAAGSFNSNQVVSLAIFTDSFNSSPVSSTKGLLYWVTLDNGSITNITEQYQP